MFIKNIGDQRRCTLVCSFIMALGLLSCKDNDKALLTEAQPMHIQKSVIPAEDVFMEFAQQFADSLEWSMYVHGCPGLAVAIVHDTNTLIKKGFGVENANTGYRVNINSVFRLGSVSKGFAAVLTQILVKEKYFNWDDQVIKYVPEFKLKTQEQTDKVTIKNLLSQSTGLPPHTFTNQIENGLSLEQIIPMLENVNLVADTGQICTYQNVTYAIIEKVIESATGKSFEELLKEKIFIPLGMENASMDCEQMWLAKSKASPHKFDRNLESYVPAEYNEKYYNIISAGGVNASIADMDKYLKLLMGKYPEILEREALEKFFIPVVSSGYERKYFHRWEDLVHDYYALGWRVFDYNGERWIYHGGFVNGFRAEVAINLKYDLSICMLFNSTCHLSDLATKMFFDQFIEYNYCQRQQL